VKLSTKVKIKDVYRTFQAIFIVIVIAVDYSITDSKPVCSLFRFKTFIFSLSSNFSYHNYDKVLHY
jgi:hypothetical protein